MDDYEILCGITLNRIFGYEPSAARALISRFGSPGAVFSQSSSTLDEVFGPTSSAPSSAAPSLTPLSANGRR